MRPINRLLFLRQLRGLARLVSLAPLILLGACASFQAHPQPVLETSALIASANFNIPDALTAFGDEEGANDRRSGLSRREFRNMVVGTLLMAADARYLQFRRRLAAEARGSSLLLDIGILGLSNGASIAGESTANALAAGAAGLTGTRAAVSRDVYFDRTIPAMIGIMDAQRTQMRTGIMTSLRRPADEYPLAIALSDVASYEAAASLDGAIEILTREAAERSEQAREQYAEDVQNYTGPPEAGVADIKRQVRTHLRTLERTGNRAELVEAATAIGIANITDEMTAQQLRFAIEDAMANARTVAAAREFAEKLHVTLEESQ